MESIIKKVVHYTITLLCFFCMCCSLCSCGCRVSPGTIRMRKEGLLPYTWEFPNMKWTCREMDLEFYTFDLKHNGMIGTYTVNGTSYRATASLGFTNARVDIGFYSSTDKTVSTLDPALEHCERNRAGFIATSYRLDKGTGNLVFTCVNYEAVDGETIPDRFTLEQAGTIAQTPKTRWIAEELDFYLDTFEDADGYLKGEITVDGEKHTVHALEIGNDNYYTLYLDDDYMVNLIFEITEDKITARVTDTRKDTLKSYEPSTPSWYENWNDDLKTISFKLAPVE